MADSAGTEAAGRVADVLLVFLAGPESLGVSALARDLGLSKAVVHRILRTLVQRGFLETDAETREYRLGPSAAALGARALRGLDLRATALPVLRELQRSTGETTTVSAHVPGGRVYLDQVESAREIKMTVELGRRFPLHAGGSSTCILAFLPDEEIEAVLAGPKDQLTPAHHRRHQPASGNGSATSGPTASPVRTASARRAPAPSPLRSSASTAWSRAPSRCAVPRPASTPQHGSGSCRC